MQKEVILLDEATYNTLLTKLSEAEMRLKINVSDISVIDEAKNLGQRSYSS